MDKTRSKKCIEVTLKSRYSSGQPISLEYPVTGLWTPPGVFRLQTGYIPGRTVNALWIAKDGTWVYNEGSAEWVHPEDMPAPHGIAEGIQNPELLFAVLGAHLDDAHFREGSLALTVTGQDVWKLPVGGLAMGDQDQDRSRMDLTFSLSQDGILTGVSFKAKFIGTENNIARNLDFSGELTFVGKDKQAGFTFRDTEGRVVLLSSDLEKRIAKASSGQK